MRTSYLVTYDICDEKRLRKVFHVMWGYGVVKARGTNGVLIARMDCGWTRWQRICCSITE